MSECVLWAIGTLSAMVLGALIAWFGISALWR